MDTELLRNLRAINEEERRILAGGGIDRAIYMEGAGSVVNSRKLLAAGKLITVRKHTRFVGFPEHTHDYVEMVYMCAGQTTHIVNGNALTLAQGDLLLLNQHARQAIQPAGENDIAVNFIILPAFFDRTMLMMGAEENVLRQFIVSHLRDRRSGGGYLHFRVAGVLPVQNLIENLLWTLVNDAPNKRGINQLTMGLLFLQLLNYADKLDSGSEGDDLAIRVLRYIEENYAQGSLTELAGALHHDVYWLSREVKKLTGQSYKELLQAKRVRQAKFLLDTTDLPVADVAAQVGYSNTGYFHRLFHGAAGCSPRAYRFREASAAPAANARA